MLTDGINLLEVITEEVQSYANAPLRLKGQPLKLSVNTLKKTASQSRSGEQLMGLILWTTLGPIVLDSDSHPDSL